MLSHFPVPISEKLHISEKELDEKLQVIDRWRCSFLPETHKRWKEEGERVYQLGTNVFYDLLDAVTSKEGDLLGDFGELNRFIQQEGIEEYHYLEPDEVFKE